MHVAITGASSGIGYEMAQHASRQGADVTVVARRRDLLEEMVRGIKTRSFVVEQDLSDLARCVDWVGPAETTLGPIDVLVNNAGVQIVAPLQEVAVEQGERLIAVNLLAPLRIMQAVLPRMMARHSGTIVNIASMAALAPTPGMTHYNASKGGLAAASEALRGELRNTGVNVVTVYPGIIDSTDMAKNALRTYGENQVLALVPRGTTTQLALEVFRAVERRRARVIYPRSGVLARWFPGPTRWFIDRATPQLKAASA